MLMHYMHLLFDLNRNVLLFYPDLQQGLTIDNKNYSIEKLEMSYINIKKLESTNSMYF